MQPSATFNGTPLRGMAMVILGNDYPFDPSLLMGRLYAENKLVQ